MQIYIQILSLFFLSFLSIPVAFGQTTGAAEPLNNQPAMINADSPNNFTKDISTAGSNRGNPACDKPETLAYEKLAAFVNDSGNRRTGECVVVENVPVFSEIKNAEDEFGNRKGLFYLETASQTDVGDTFFCSNSISEHLSPFLKIPEAKSLRVTALLVEMQSDFDLFRAPFVVNVEGLDENNQVVWTASGTSPEKLKFRF